MEERADYEINLVISGASVPFTTADGRKWLMRQPTPEEAAAGNSAYRLMYKKILADPRLKEIAGSEEALQHEARVRAAAAEAVYMIPLLLQTAAGAPAFDVFDTESLSEFEALGAGAVSEMTTVYWNVIQEIISSAKKKTSNPDSS